MNLLAGYDKSIVTAIAGTTRDVVEESVSLDDLVLNLSDTAGIRATDDEVERIGVDKAMSRLRSASLILCVFDASRPLDDEDRAIIGDIDDAPALAILNKADLPNQITPDELGDRFKKILYLSAKHGEGFDDLIAAIKKICAAEEIDSSGALVYNERQRSLALKARDSVAEAIEAMQMGMTYDAVTISIEEAIAYLCELTGERVSDEVVDRVFHSFCVGK
jgi:tRNA modification GTPase